jgi:hypothetical protein
MSLLSQYGMDEGEHRRALYRLIAKHHLDGSRSES